MDKRIVVAVDGWDADSTHPAGHYVRTLGTIGDKDTETVRGACTFNCTVCIFQIPANSSWLLSIVVANPLTMIASAEQCLIWQQQQQRGCMAHMS